MNDIAPLELESEPATAETATKVCPWQAFAAAVCFLTRVPLRAGLTPTNAVLAAAPGWFPLVGLMVGSATAGTIYLGTLVWPLWLAVLLALAVEALLTGALHEDAFADCCDAFGGGRDRENILRVLKDSRLGTYGVLGLGLGVALRAGATVAIIERHGEASWLAWGVAIAAGATIGRWSMVLGLWLVPPLAARESLSRGMDQSGRGPLVWATLLMAPVAALWTVQSPVGAVLAVLFLVPVVGGLLHAIRARLGGSTGDCVGAIGYAAQLVVLLAAAARTGL